jgi:opacity protein-like surface antigen
MKQRNIIAATLTALVLATSVGSAQAPKKPPVKVKITKEPVKPEKKAKTAGGDVALPPQVKIEQTTPCEVVIPTTSPLHDDSIRAEQYRLDSVGAGVQREEATRALDRALVAERERVRLDSIAAADAQARALARMLARGMYLAVAGGASAPQRDLRNGYTGGWNVTVPIGYDATDNPFGIRLDASIDHMNGTRLHDQSETTIAASGDVTVWSLNVDGKFRIHPPGSPSRTHFYLLGGVGAHKVGGGIYGTSGADAGKDLSFSSAQTKFGWNAGAGAAFGWNGVELFVESRFFQVNSDLGFHQAGGVGTYTAFSPMVIGLNWF